MLEGQINLRDAVRRTITFADPVTGEELQVGGDNRLRCCSFGRADGTWKSGTCLWTGEPMSGFALRLWAVRCFTMRRSSWRGGRDRTFYLPKMESHLEARLWNDVFVAAEAELGLKLRVSIKATVLIETILASFEMDEILYELRDHSAGLELRAMGLHFFVHQEACRGRNVAVLPDRSQVAMTTHFHAELFAAGDQDVPSSRCPVRWAV